MIYRFDLHYKDGYIEYLEISADDDRQARDELHRILDLLPEEPERIVDITSYENE